MAYNSARHDKRPQGGHWVCLQRLWHSHVVLGILSLDGTRLVLCDLRLLVEVVHIVHVGDGLLHVRVLGTSLLVVDNLGHVC